MSIGTGIVLFIIGAILTFAVNVDLGWVDLDLIGYLLMGAGLVVFVIGLVFMFRRRQSVTTVSNNVDPATGSSVQERRTAESNDTPTL